MGRGGGSRAAKGGGGGGGGGGTTTPTAPADTTVTTGGVATTPLTKDERSALDGYSGFGYKDVNLMLRDDIAAPRDPTVRAEVATKVVRIEAAINKGTLAAETTLYRGTSMHFLGDLTPGTVIKDKAFLSTSRSQNAASYFGMDAMLRITAPRGTRGADVSHHTGGYEKEILLGRNTKLRVTGVSTSGGRTVVDVTVVR